MRISEERLNEGANEVTLSVRKADGTTEDITYTVTIESAPTTPPIGMCHNNNNSKGSHSIRAILDIISFSCDSRRLYVTVLHLYPRPKSGSNGNIT